MQKQNSKKMLNRYQGKRNFSSSPEPEGKVKVAANDKLTFVVHQHFASHLHYDLRLELDGVLKSWAIPKEPTLDPKIKRLAVMVEDHPLEYRLFEGTIPEGNYGAGRVNIWDEGTYNAVGAAGREQSEKILKDGLKKGHISFILEGKRLKGEFALVRIWKAEEKNWLLIKKDDQYARHPNNGS